MCDYGFPKKNRLRTRLDYKKMASRSKRYMGAFLIIDVRKNGRAVTRLGITVTKKFGDAHKRNRFKRIVREAFRLSYKNLISGIDINIRPVHKFVEISTPQLQTELLQFLKND